MSEQGFEPGRHLMKIGGKEYLPVAWRLVWLRSEHPDATVTSELVSLDEVTLPNKQVVPRALFKATVSIPGGGSATDYGSETANDFPDFIEKGSTKAIGRALGALGFGTQFCDDFDTGISRTTNEPRIVDSPQTRQPNATPPPSVRPGPSSQATGGITEKQVAFASTLARGKGMSDADLEQMVWEDYGKGLGELDRHEASALIEGLKAPAADRVAGPVIEAPPAGGAGLAAWTDLYTFTRDHNLKDKNQIERFLGVPMAATPDAAMEQVLAALADREEVRV